MSTQSLESSPNTSPLDYPSDDPLAPELAAVAAWVEEITASRSRDFYYLDVELKSTPSGQAILDGNAEQSKRYLLAAVRHVQHWDLLADQQRKGAVGSSHSIHLRPEWGHVWGRRLLAYAVVKTLFRRSLPFSKEDLATLIQWCQDTEDISSYFYPMGSIGKAIERFAKDRSLEQQFSETIGAFIEKLRSSNDKDAKKVASSLDRFYIGSAPVSEGQTPSKLLPPPVAAPFGSSQVMRSVKAPLGAAESIEADEIATLEPDQFPLSANSPLRSEHEKLSQVFAAVAAETNHRGREDFFEQLLEKLVVGATLEQLGRFSLAAAERQIHLTEQSSRAENPFNSWQIRYAISQFTIAIMRQNYELTRDGLFDLLLYLFLYHRDDAIQDSIIARIMELSTAVPLTEGERFALALYRETLVLGPLFGKMDERIRVVTKLIGDKKQYFLVPGEAWVDKMHTDFAAMPADLQSKWCDFLRHTLTATSSRPSAKWLKVATQLVEAIGPKSVGEVLRNWLPQVVKGNAQLQLGVYKTAAMHEENANALRGLIWCIPLLPDRDELARLVTAVAISAYKKVPGVGPRATKVGNAAIYCLSELGTKESVGQLAMLKVRVKFGSAQKEIEKAFDAAAAALELPRDQIEELGVPSYGLEEVGKLTETLGDYKAELMVTGSDASLNWFDEKGKQLKSVPVKVKSDHKEELKELQQSLKDIQSMLPAQRDRIDALFLAQKTWSIHDWRERYHDHPLVGTIAQRLIWLVDGTPALFVGGEPTDVAGKSIVHGKTAEIALWHPVGRPIEEIVAWRRRLETLQITQPFKQAHREVYLLTDAERNTNTYSNRYAAHVIRQHQFNALCAARRWKNKLRLCVDDYFPPATRELPLWGLRAEFWIEGLGDGFGVDTNDSGVYLRLTTDQVRFYRDAASTNMAHAGGGGYGSNATGPGTDNINDPLTLDQIPPLVFSEIMRDVDLFVGVASIGNDPTWQDGGPEGRFRDYWQGYSFGALSGTATTRKEVLERLVPRLKIASRCSFSERFLVVRGDKRTYKIHLGSGNILMEPNDQYLCIVPDAKARASQDDMYLPFEGDNVLSIIISKALLLADDTKIKDPTITRQIAI